MTVVDGTVHRPRVLMISPEFYPCQVISAHRSGKFCKYLPQSGYDVSVLTVDARKAGWAVDERLGEQLPAATERIEAFYPFQKRLKEKARNLRQLVMRFRGSSGEGGSKERAGSGELDAAQAWLVPDKDILWTPWAIQRGLPAARRADVLYATGPAFSTLVIAAILKKMTRRPLVIDLRDPWTLSHLKLYPLSIHRRLDAWFERWTFRAADAIICNTEAVRAGYLEKYPGLPASRFTVISNGYDEEDFADLPPSTRVAGKVRLGYFGTIYAGRDPGPLFQAARRAVDAGLIAPGTLEFVFYGPSSKIVAAVADQAGASEMVSLNPTVPYAEALRQMAACDVLLLMGSASTDELHIPGKAFEYLAMRKPILALAGPGALGDLMKRYQFGLRVSPDDAEGLFAALRALHEDMLAGKPEKYLGSDCTGLSRRRLTGELATLFDRVRPSARNGA